ESCIGIQPDPHIACAPCLGGYQNYSVTGTATVDGLRRRIFQHFDRLYIGCTDVRNVAGDHSVDYVYRIGITADRTYPTYAYLRLRARFPGRSYLHPARFSL